MSFTCFANEVRIFVFSSITAENLGFTSYPPAYLSKKAKGKNLLGGANFASAASGYFDATAKLYVKTLKSTIMLQRELSFLKNLTIEEVVNCGVHESQLCPPLTVNHFNNYKFCCEKSCVSSIIESRIFSLTLILILIKLMTQQNS